MASGNMNTPLNPHLRKTNVMPSPLSVVDLRVGNYLMRDGVMVKIDARSIFDIWNDVGIDKLGYEPILLTKDWLLRFGFREEEKSPSHNHENYYSIWIMDYKYSFAYASFRNDWGFYHSYTDANNDEYNDRFDFISCGIKYVHELQNLYYSLVHEELSCNDR